MAEIVGGRLEALIKDRGTNQSEVARASGMTQPSIGRLISGETKETGKLLELARALRTTPEYLVGETDDPDLSGLQDRHQSYLGKAAAAAAGEVEIIGIDQRYGLGGTYVDNPVEEQPMRFPLAWIRQFTDAPPELLRWTAGQGDSMVPTIGDGDPLLIDLRQNTIRSRDAIWAFAVGQIGGIKRLRPQPDGSVEILSDNPNVPIDRAAEDELHVIGRVVAVVRRI